MNKKIIIRKTEHFVRQQLKGDSGHDWSHIERVRKLALYIGRKEKADLFVVELGALLHDVADWKFHKDEKAGGKLTRAWLEKNQIDPKIIAEVTYIVDNISWKEGRSQNRMKTIEGKVVQDADRLEALGAIGIARAFNYGGYMDRPMYGAPMSTIGHFYEKILKVRGKMNTSTGRKLARERDLFVKLYLKQFLREWAGKR